MSVTQAGTDLRTDLAPRAAASDGVLATGSVLGAVLASACCILPLLLVTLGVSGAWLGRLTALEPYSPYIGAATVLLIGAGFWRVHRRPPACAADSYCARPLAARVSRIALWFASLLVVATFSIGLWAPWFY